MISMTRREALKTASALLGGALIVPAVLTGCAPEDQKAAPKGLRLDDEALLGHIADTLLPTTAASPGAAAAGVGATMFLLLSQCQPAEVQQRVADGLQELRAACRARGVASFDAMKQAQREQLLGEIDAAAQKAGDTHWFAVARGLALHSYFTSEIGMTQATRFVLVPGRWEGCIPLEPGQPAWG
ncbi:MAG TPA: gluconate 2-dehydrogenase subunit 3 family protein [Pseudoxanthomonas sp.]|nr:gluconate 2-dehydrogenase subunit 3 family protein [Pseudoxanthomonas sp.]